MAMALSHASGAALRAATRSADEPRLFELTVVANSGKYDLCLPVSSNEQMAALVADIEKWDSVKDSGAKSNLLAPLSSAITAGELYETQVKASVTRYTKTLESIATDYGKVGKYTKEHAQQMLAARGRLRIELADVFPPANFYRIASSDPALDSVQAALRENSDVHALAKVSGKTSTNLARNVVKRGRTAVSAADDIPVIIDKRIVDKLKLLDKLLIAVKLAPLALAALQAENDVDQQKALNEFYVSGAGVFVDKLIGAGGMTFCAAFAVTSLGWGLIACGLGFTVAGSYIGGYAEREVKKKLDASPLP